MENLFFILILFSVLAYGIGLPLLTVYARKLDGLTITVYSNLSFIITMFPLLFFAEMSEILEILNHLPMLLLASISGFIAVASLFSANKYLPVGLNGGIKQGIYIIFAFILSYLFFNEKTTPIEFLIIFVILISTILLSFMKMDLKHLDIQHMNKGITYVIVSGVFQALSYFSFASLSRNLSPFVATYFWEAGIGVAALMFILIFGGHFGVPKLKRISNNQILKISIVSTLAIIGTLCYSFAIKIGNFAIATSLLTTTIVVYTIAGYILFKEKLNIKQITLMSIIIISVMVLKLIS
ncbi:MAG: DMT family transporter [Nanoarchaeales archaeon]|nr:DMT family transporter [Nanoarchaeales archaeon]